MADQDIRMLESCQSQLGYQFQDITLLKQALRHRSIGSDNNERLEFLGDSVLGIIITDNLFQQYPERREGDLSRLRSMLVNGQVLSDLAIALSLDQFIVMGSGEERTREERKSSILADSVEAVIGAIYLDGGLMPCRETVLSWYRLHVEDVVSLAPQKDAKTLLQEWCQAQQKSLPLYSFTVSGPAHQQIFTVNCVIEGLGYQAQATGPSRRKAEQKAAAKYWEWLKHG